MKPSMRQTILGSEDKPIPQGKMRHERDLAYPGFRFQESVYQAKTDPETKKWVDQIGRKPHIKKEVL